MINDAVNFLMEAVINPALDCTKLDKSFKNKIHKAKTLIKNFKKTGDLYKYLKRFDTGHGYGNDTLYTELKKLNLKTFEDVFPSFKDAFKYEINDVTILNDFIIGGNYSSYDISIMAECYNIQKSIYLVNGSTNLKAIFIKTTLNNGIHKNQWLTKDEELKYYIFSSFGKYSLDYKYNKEIINSNETPIYVFIKNDTSYTLTGIFKYVDYTVEEDASKWFRLKKLNSLNSKSPITDKEFEKELNKRVSQSIKLSKAEREEKISTAPKKPKKVNVITTNYKRNPDVIAEVLARAKGICEECKKDAPFIRASDNTPYLEVHHVIPLSQGGDDTVENAVGLCPNCHRKMHFGKRE